MGIPSRFLYGFCRSLSALHWCTHTHTLFNTNIHTLLNTHSVLRVVTEPPVLDLSCTLSHKIGVVCGRQAGVGTASLGYLQTYVHTLISFFFFFLSLNLNSSHILSCTPYKKAERSTILPWSGYQVVFSLRGGGGVWPTELPICLLEIWETGTRLKLMINVQFINIAEALLGWISKVFRYQFIYVVSQWESVAI